MTNYDPYEEIVLKPQDWEYDPTLKCKICGTTARKHPRVDEVRACPKCDFVTNRLFSSFDEVI